MDARDHKKNGVFSKNLKSRINVKYRTVNSKGFKMLIILFGISAQLTIAQTNCKAVAKFAAYSCNAITEEMCYASVNPATCAVAALLALDASEWGDNLVERGFEAGCSYTVKVTSDGYEVTVEGAKSAVDNFIYEFKRYVLKDNWQYYSGY